MKDIVYASFIAGSTQTILGHPFDTIKTITQINPNFSIQNIHQNYIKPNGWKYLYRGSISPFLGGCLQNCFIFSTEHISKKWIEKINGNKNPILNSFYSGFISGGLTSIIISPTELIKTFQQINPKITIKEIINQNSLLRGFSHTFIRDSIGFGIYFSTYNYLQTKWQNNPLINGGIAGVLSWTYSYPIDVIKTKYQSNPNITTKQILKNITIQNLKAGFTIMILRSFFVNAGIFYTFEKCKIN